ncbi:MAG: hypothetical protein WDM86_22260 [Rhizomicrobium sp.]
MRDFTMVSPRIWMSPKFWALPSNEERFVYLYVLTGQHQNGAGAYHLPVGYAAADLRSTPVAVTAALGELNQAGLIEFDPATSEVLIVGWFDLCKPQNAKHYEGVKRRIAQLLSARLRDIAEADAARAWAECEAGRAARALQAAPSSSQRSMSSVLLRNVK